MSKCRVFMSGFQPQKFEPDIRHCRAINDLHLNCRKCQVFPGGESWTEKPLNPSLLAHLNDA